MPHIHSIIKPIINNAFSFLDIFLFVTALLDRAKGIHVKWSIATKISAIDTFELVYWLITIDRARAVTWASAKKMIIL